MLFILLLIIAPTAYIECFKTTSPVSINFDGFTSASWKQRNLWNQTRTIIVQHLNKLCKNDRYCDAQYGIQNIHLLNVKQSSSSSIQLNISIDNPIVSNRNYYNYTALLTSALFQTKIDIEHLHDNELFNAINSSSIDAPQTSVINRTSRLLFVFLGITLVGIVFALTIIFVQKIHTFKYSKLFKTTTTTDEVPEEQLNNAPSTLPLNI